MKLPSKLVAVMRHEYLTIVKQPTFWIIMLALPAIAAVLIGLSYITGRSTQEKIDQAAANLQNVVVIDESGLINDSILAATKVAERPVSDTQTVIAEVRQGSLNGAIIYPSDLLKTRQYRLYSSATDFTRTSTMTAFADGLLKNSLYAPLGSPEIIALAQQGASAQVVSYKDGRETAGFMEYIVPGLFLVLFYLVLVFSVNYMLTSVAEEKENRSMEMVLSYVKPRTLILGKLLGISLVTLTQLLFMLGIAAAVFLIARQMDLTTSLLPIELDWSRLVFDPSAIFFGLSYLLFGFLLFAALMAGVGAMVPSAKDAGPLSAVFIVSAILPFYTIGMLTSDPGNGLSRFLTYFPTTAPTALLLRNTVGNLSTLEQWLGLGLLIIWSILAVLLAARLFRLGALEFTNRVSLKDAFRRS